MLWLLGFGLALAWVVLHFGFHKRGLVHLLILSGISILIVQVMAYRKTKYQREIAKK